ncbi:MAG: TonB family protein [Terriglobales bacterium]
MSLPHEKQVPEIKDSFKVDAVHKQRRQMLAALALLLVALILVLRKDRNFWFPPAPTSQSGSEPLEEAQSEKETTMHPTLPAQPKSKLPTSRKAAAREPNPASASAPVVTSRTVLPPLGVEVVIGNEHSNVPAGSNSVEVDLGSKAPSASTQTSSAQPMSKPAGVTSAAERVHLSPGTAQILAHRVEPKYPLLAKEMNIQGSVVLEALIGRDGIIQQLRLLSGPAILSRAAREAVKQWRFKPYLESGQAVETQARIVVNFSIWTQDINASANAVGGAP